VTDPIFREVVGDRAQALSALLGFEIAPGALVAILPPSVDVQWYVDNSAIAPENEAIWWSLSAPDRIVLTRNEIKETLTEIANTRTAAVKKLALERQRLGETRSRTQLLDVIAPLSQEIETCDVLAKNLRRTFADLDRHHDRLSFKFNRPVDPAQEH